MDRVPLGTARVIGPDAVIVAGPASAALATRVAEAAGLPVQATRRRRFPDGETCVAIEEPGRVRGRRAVIVQGLHPPQAEHLVELCQLASVAHAHGARSVAAVVPYLGYARQDRACGPGEPVTFSVVLRLLRALDVREIGCVEVHNPLAATPRDGLSNLRTDALFAQALGPPSARTVVVAPDAGRIASAALVAGRMGCDVVRCTKNKTADGLTSYPPLDAALHGADVVVVDDLASTGSTLVPFAEGIRQQSPRSLTVCVTHLFCDPDELSSRLGGARVLTTDTIPGPGARLSVAGLIATWVRDGSDAVLDLDAIAAVEARA